MKDIINQLKPRILHMLKHKPAPIDQLRRSLDQPPLPAILMALMELENNRRIDIDTVEGSKMARLRTFPVAPSESVAIPEAPESKQGDAVRLYMELMPADTHYVLRWRDDLVLAACPPSLAALCRCPVEVLQNIRVNVLPIVAPQDRRRVAEALAEVQRSDQYPKHLCCPLQVHRGRAIPAEWTLLRTPVRAEPANELLAVVTPTDSTA